ncbi:MAG: hypothetical protein RL166_226 [Actinomycetota bacterium]
MRSPTGLVSERGAGTVLALGMVTAIVGVTLLMFRLGNIYVDQVRLNALADAAAIAAADALRGLVAGYPCEVARDLAPVSACEILGNDVLITVSKDGLSSKARAGEPG